MLISLLGPAGAGKGTLALRLEARGFHRFESGGALRDWAAKNDPELAAHLSGGGMAPTPLVIKLLGGAMGEKEGDWILDGLPRNLGQAEAMAERYPDLVVVLQASEAILTERLINRTTCPGCGAIYNAKTRVAVCSCGSIPKRRSDDNFMAIKKRLDLYKSQTEAGISYLRDAGVQIIEVDATMAMEAIEQTVRAAVDRATNARTQPERSSGRRP